MSLKDHSLYMNSLKDSNVEQNESNLDDNNKELKMNNNRKSHFEEKKILKDDISTLQNMDIESDKTHKISLFSTENETKILKKQETIQNLLNHINNISSTTREDIKENEIKIVTKMKSFQFLPIQEIDSRDNSNSNNSNRNDLKSFKEGIDFFQEQDNNELLPNPIIRAEKTSNINEKNEKNNKKLTEIIQKSTEALNIQIEKQKKLEGNFEKLMGCFSQIKEKCFNLYDENSSLKEKIKELESKKAINV